jgi:hypothetical protein
MAQARGPVVLAAWPAVISTGLFVLVTHFVEIAAGAPLSFLVLDTSLALVCAGGSNERCTTGLSSI